MACGEDCCTCSAERSSIGDIATLTQWAGEAVEGKVDHAVLARLIGLSTELVALRNRVWQLAEALDGSGPPL